MLGGRLGVGALPLGRRWVEVPGGGVLCGGRGRSGGLLPAPGAVRVCEAADLETLGGLEEGVELVLRHVHLAVVHELEQGEEVVILDVSQDYDGVLARVALEEQAGGEGGRGVEEQRARGAETLP